MALVGSTGPGPHRTREGPAALDRSLVVPRRGRVRRRRCRRMAAGRRSYPRHGGSATGRISSRCTTTRARTGSQPNLLSRRCWHGGAPDEEPDSGRRRGGRSCPHAAGTAARRRGRRRVPLRHPRARRPFPSRASRMRDGAAVHRRDHRAGSSAHPPQRRRARSALARRLGCRGRARRVREYLGWEEVRSQLQDQIQDAVREGMLSAWPWSRRASAIPDAIRQAWSIVISVNERNDIHAFKATVGSRTAVRDGQGGPAGPDSGDRGQR